MISRCVHLKMKSGLEQHLDVQETDKPFAYIVYGLAFIFGFLITVLYLSFKFLSHYKNKISNTKRWEASHYLLAISHRRISVDKKTKIKQSKDKVRYKTTTMHDKLYHCLNAARAVQYN